MPTYLIYDQVLFSFASTGSLMMNNDSLVHFDVCCSSTAFAMDVIYFNLLGDSASVPLFGGTLLSGLHLIIWGLFFFHFKCLSGWNDGMSWKTLLLHFKNLQFIIKGILFI